MKILLRIKESCPIKKKCDHNVILTNTHGNIAVNC